MSWPSLLVGIAVGVVLAPLAIWAILIAHWLRNGWGP